MLTAILVGAWPAAAQTDEAAAEVLFREAQALFAEGKFAEACPKFAASQRLDPGLGTLLNLARCYESEGRTASAWVAYVELLPLAERAEQDDRAGIARERIEALKPRLVRLQLEVGERPAGLEVAVDGEPMPPAVYGTAVPIDPGEHAVTARAPGFEGWSMRVRLDEEGKTVTVRIPNLEARTPAPAPPPPPPTPRPVSPAPRPEPVPEEPSGGGALPWMIAGGVVGGAGLVALGIGGAFAGMAASDWEDAEDDGCGDDFCPTPDAQGTAEDAGAKADIATGLTIAGGVVAAAGLTLFLIGVLDDDDEPSVGVGPGGLLVRF